MLAANVTARPEQPRARVKTCFPSDYPPYSWREAGVRNRSSDGLELRRVVSVGFTYCVGQLLGWLHAP